MTSGTAFIYLMAIIAGFLALQALFFRLGSLLAVLRRTGMGNAFWASIAATAGLGVLNSLLRGAGAPWQTPLISGLVLWLLPLTLMALITVGAYGREEPLKTAVIWMVGSLCPVLGLLALRLLAPPDLVAHLGMVLLPL